MSDDTEKKADASSQQSSDKTKSYSEEEFKAVVAQRDEIKKKLRDIEEAERKVSEAKKVEDGKAKELLAEKEKLLEVANSQLENLKKNMDALRQELIGKIPDPELKALAEKLPDLADIQKLVEKSQQKSPITFQGKGAADTGGSGIKAKDMIDWQRQMQEKGLGV